MILSINDINISSYLSEYDIGEIISFEPLESGFESDNLKLNTKNKSYVARFIYKSPQRIRDSMKISEYYVLNNFKNALPIKNTSGDYLVNIDQKHSFVIQSFINGKGFEREKLKLNKKLRYEMVPIYGKYLGKFHTIGSNTNINLLNLEIISKKSEISDEISISHNSFLQIPEDQIIINEYEKWKIKRSELKSFDITWTLIHGDIKPYDFFFFKNEFSGLLDLTGVTYGIALEDLASLIMYTELWKNENEQACILFLNSYLKSGPIKKKELKILHHFLTTRAFIQIFYFTWRIQNNYLQGVDNNEENTNGFNNGINLLKRVKKLSETYFFDIMQKSSKI
ncbi:MAG: phosphotransferase [Candidatus Hodarchaeales archaeon]|jgi:Ser/Thr protein kinase RdoA (MazF antagonist)